MSIAKRPSGKWRAQFHEFPGGPRRTKVFDRKGDAQRWLDEQRVNIARGEYVDPTAWMAAQPWRGSTRDKTESMYRTHIEPKFGVRPIGSLRTSELQAWATGLGATLAPSTVEGTYRLLSSILRAAVADRVIARSPADGVRLPRREAEIRVPLSVGEVVGVAENIVPELEVAVLVAAATGLRQGELFGITEDRVLWLKRELVIDRQLVTPSKGAPFFGPCKTARSTRTVPVTDEVLSLLAQHRQRFGAGDAGVVFHRDGGPWARNRAAARISDAATKAKVGVTGWHALRHHTASVLIAQGLGVTAVARMLGHSPAECLATYAHWWPNEDDQIRKAIARTWATSAAAAVCD